MLQSTCSTPNTTFIPSSIACDKIFYKGSSNNDSAPPSSPGSESDEKFAAHPPAAVLACIDKAAHKKWQEVLPQDPTQPGKHYYVVTVGKVIGVTDSW